MRVNCSFIVQTDNNFEELLIEYNIEYNVNFSLSTYYVNNNNKFAFICGIA